MRNNPPQNILSHTWPCSTHVLDLLLKPSQLLKPIAKNFPLSAMEYVCNHRQSMYVITCKCLHSCSSVPETNQSSRIGIWECLKWGSPTAVLEIFSRNTHQLSVLYKEALLPLKNVQTCQNFDVRHQCANTIHETKAKMWKFRGRTSASASWRHHRIHVLSLWSNSPTLTHEHKEYTLTTQGSQSAGNIDASTCFMSHFCGFLWTTSDFLQHSHCVFKAAERSQFPPGPVNRGTHFHPTYCHDDIKLRGGVFTESSLGHYVFSSLAELIPLTTALRRGLLAALAIFIFQHNTTSNHTTWYLFHFFIS